MGQGEELLLARKRARLKERGWGNREQMVFKVLCGSQGSDWIIPESFRQKLAVLDNQWQDL